MDLRQLNHFLAVADTLHFGRAAERLGMTQPPLSQSILALERALGAALFVRSKRHVELTPLGRQWAEHVRPAVRAVEDLPALAARLMAGTTGRLALSFVSTADYNLLPDLVRAYATRHPGIEVSLVEATSDVQIQALLDGGTDAGILIPTRSALPPVLDYRPLLSEPLVAAVPEAWIAAAGLDVDGDRLCGDAWMDRPLIQFPARVSPDFYDLVVGHYHRHGRRPLIRQQAIQMQTIISLVSTGMGMALVPASLRKLARSGVRYLDIADPPRIETGLAWRRQTLSAPLAALIALLDEGADP